MYRRLRASRVENAAINIAYSSGSSPSLCTQINMWHSLPYRYLFQHLYRPGLDDLFWPESKWAMKWNQHSSICVLVSAYQMMMHSL
jgi:hypothetical protein